MRKFIEFECHDYMDMHPHSMHRAMEESEVQAYVDHMNKHYSGGTTRLKRILTKEEASKFVDNAVRTAIFNPTITTTDGSLDRIDVEFIKNLYKEFYNCYK